MDEDTIIDSSIRFYKINQERKGASFQPEITACFLQRIFQIVDWPVALLMALASALGGFGGARIARRLPQPVVRGIVVAVGLASAAWLLAARG